MLKGIPFTAPPIRNLRWKAPQQGRPWEGIKKYRAFGLSPVPPSCSVYVLAQGIYNYLRVDKRRLSIPKRLDKNRGAKQKEISTGLYL